MELYILEEIKDGNYSRIFRGSLRICKTTRGFLTAVKRTRHVVVTTDSGKQSVLPYPVLRHEACALIKLRAPGHRSIQTPYAFASTQYFQYLALPMLGKPLAHIKPGTLTLRNLASIACQMISALEHVHSRGIIHCDLSLGNMMLDRPETPLPQHRVATPCYASLSCHEDRPLSFKDDLEALAYCLFHLLLGKDLPWVRVHRQDIYEVKKQLTGGLLCAGWDSVFGDFLDYSRTLDRASTPEYGVWVHRFRSISDRLRGNILYYAKDTSKPAVGHAKEPIPKVTIGTSSRSIDKPHEFRGSSARIYISGDPYIPLSGDWNEVTLLTSRYMLGDEGRMVLELPTLVKAPTYVKGAAASSECAPEELCYGL